MTAQKKIVVLVGNCQSRAIENFLKRLPDFDARHEVARFRTFQVGEAMGLSAQLAQEKARLKDYVAANKKRISLFIRQKTHGWFDDGLTESSLGKSTEIIEYPACLLNYIWPLSAHGPDRYAANRYQARYLPFSIMDREILNLREQNLSEKEFLARYMEIDVVRKYKVDRLKRLNEIKGEQVDANATFPIWPFISQNMNLVQLFRTENHPNGPLLAEILRQIKLHSRTLQDVEGYDAAVDVMRNSYGIGPLEAPVHPSIAEHFNLSWAKDRKFSFWGYMDLTFEEYALKLYRLDVDEEYQRALEMSKSDLPEALKLLHQAAARNPHVAHFKDLGLKWLRNEMLRNPSFKLAVASVRKGEVAEAAAFMERAARDLPHNNTAQEYSALYRRRLDAHIRKRLSEFMEAEGKGG
ncbi:WcbI family polysaccharide biosynthesis putative acetyltransferase [Neomegalonema sp.]|uniref:WcbI family polysaccharide biosynthesis putative acetyltransferase n=1 Tax=Neomegalonema sp. TaxID=2039713 RepID=UPI0026053239|nr:WcbI family polysaccharide biosynthesis putative acetyltransferase [Neomegalonema sp.]MDD2870017.1 WcbI family polysaccharide biosynthesis putative acetyltransferase [Neomegalonema sp.]